jgi:hypothetical protein
MKAEAANQGADTIRLYTEEPERNSSLNLYWCAEAYRTQDIEDIQ